MLQLFIILFASVSFACYFIITATILRLAELGGPLWPTPRTSWTTSTAGAWPVPRSPAASVPPSVALT